MTTGSPDVRIPASFRDPSGFLFTRNGQLFRRVNAVYRRQYDRLMNSGLYQELVDAGLLVAHREVPAGAGDEKSQIPNPKSQKGEDVYKILEPERVPFISYPYEWCFSQLKDAALATLDIQAKALARGMTLKDASAYNMQFVDGNPVLIDTLSFDEYREGEPWIAYRQFCQHFLAPLALMRYRDTRLAQLLRAHIDGIPLDLASALLPARTRLAPSLMTHIHLHARAQKRYAGRAEKAPSGNLSRFGFRAILDSLRGAVSRLAWTPGETEWGDYYDATNYSPASAEHKKALVSEALDELRPRTVWDAGANTGVFSRIASRKGIMTVSLDGDPSAVEKNYLSCRAERQKNLLPLIVDLTNPSPAIGWENEERMSLARRGPAGAVMALALLHHLAIGNNTPFPAIARFFSRIGDSLIIEFVPKSDSNARRLLATREDIFTDYAQPQFEGAFLEFFSIPRKTRIRDSERTLYVMRKR